MTEDQDQTPQKLTPSPPPPLATQTPLSSHPPSANDDDLMDKDQSNTPNNTDIPSSGSNPDPPSEEPCQPPSAEPFVTNRSEDPSTLANGNNSDDTPNTPNIRSNSAKDGVAAGNTQHNPDVRL